MNRQRLTMIGAIAVEAMLYEVSATPKPLISWLKK